MILVFYRIPFVAVFQKPLKAKRYSDFYYA